MTNYIDMSAGFSSTLLKNLNKIVINSGFMEIYFYMYIFLVDRILPLDFWICIGSVRN